MYTLPDVHMVCVMSGKLKGSRAAGVAQIYTAEDGAAVLLQAGPCVNTLPENAKQRLPVRLPALLYNLCIQPRLNTVTAHPNRLYPSWPTLGKQNTSRVWCMLCFPGCTALILSFQLEGWCKKGRRVSGDGAGVGRGGWDLDCPGVKIWVPGKALCSLETRIWEGVSHLLPVLLTGGVEEVKQWLVARILLHSWEALG